MKNRHPVDELFEVRKNIAELEVRATELRACIRNGECSLDGDDHIAMVKRFNRRSMTLEIAEKTMGRDWVNENADVVVTDRIVIRRKNEYVLR